MLLRRGVSSLSPAIALRQSLSGPSRAAARSWSTSSCQFSQARPAQPAQQWSRSSSTLRGHGSPLPRLAQITLLRSSTVFMGGLGTSRSLSLWPFASKQQPQPSGSLPAESTETSLSLPSSSSAKSAWTQPASDPTSTFAQNAPTEVSQASSQLDSLSASFDPNSFAELASTSSILDLPEQIGYLKMLGLDFGWGPSAIFQWILEHIYIYTGMPWWASLAALAVAWRVAFFMPTLEGTRNAAKLQALRQNPDFKAAEAAMWAANASGKQAEMMMARAQMVRMQKQAGASMLKSMLPLLITVPFTFGGFRVMRAMAALPVPSLENGGLAWFTDLSVYDPLYILPLTASAITILSMKQHQAAMNKVGSNPQQEMMMKGFMWIMTPLMVLCTMWLPAAVQWFFLCFGATQAVQTTLTLNPAFRRWADLPPLVSTPTLPKTKGVSILGQAGATYQAPQPTARPGIKGMIQDMQEGTKESLSKYVGGTDSASRKKALEYEKKRAKEDQARKLQREEEFRRRQMLKQQDNGS